MKKPRQVLVGLKTKEHTVELTDAACRMSAPGANLLLVHVIEVPDATPLDAPLPALENNARDILRTGGRLARRSGKKVRTLILRARSAGRALLDTMAEEKVDLAILGSHHGHTLGEFLFGTTHQFLAKHAPCQVLLSIPPHRAVRAARAA